MTPIPPGGLRPSSTADDVVRWWFAGWNDQGPLATDDPAVARWTALDVGSDPALDEEVRETFGALHAEVAALAHDDWEGSAGGTLAKVLVLDQLSRALFRGTGRAFVWDAEARATTQRALERAYESLWSFLTGTV